MNVFCSTMGDGGTGVGGLHLEINRLNLERKSGFVKSVRPVEKLGCLKQRNILGIAT